MSIAPHVTTILDSRGNDTRGTSASQGRTGKLVMLPVEPGVGQVPARSSAPNPASGPIMGRNTVGRRMEDVPFSPGIVTGLFRQATR